MTIVVLIILAVISINVVIGENGLIAKAKLAVDMQKIGEYMDKFALAEANALLRDVESLGEITLEDFIDEVIEQGIIPRDNIKQEGEKYILTAPEGYEFEAVLKAENDVEVTYISKGEATETPDEPEAVVVTGITIINDSTKCFNEGSTITLTAEILPNNAENKTIIWESGNAEVVTINENGEVTAKGLGTTTITAKATDGSNVTGMYTITVNPKAGTELATTPDTWESTAVTPIADGNGGTIPLPDNFYYVGGHLCEGIVISDKANDTMDATGTSMGNQYVWIPVEEDEFERQNLTNLSESEWAKYTEPYSYDDETGYDEESTEYETMYNKVIQYGGFYIGRFEAGINDSTTPRAEGDEAEEVVVKKGVYPYNYVAWGDSMTSKGTEGAVYLAQHMYTGKTQSSSVTSTLIYGVQWDAMCRYIGDYTRTTATKNGPGLTGSVSTDVSKNIYDLAGNCYEWTMEAYYFDDRVGRGGYYNNASPMSSRSNYFYPVDDVGGYADLAFRPGLYIK